MAAVDAQLQLAKDLREAEHAATLADFLASLAMRADSADACPRTLPRVTQLLSKPHPFHPTAKRYSEPELRALAADPHTRVRHYSLRDRFGDHGLIAAAVLRRAGADAEIDAWVMCCRVSARTLEHFICQDLVKEARALGASRLIGRFVPDGRNVQVADLYRKLGFAQLTQDGGASTWTLCLAAEAPLRTFVRARVAAAPSPDARPADASLS